MQRSLKETSVFTYLFWWTCSPYFLWTRKRAAQLAPTIKNQIKQYIIDNTQIKITKQAIKKKNKIDVTPD